MEVGGNFKRRGQERPHAGDALGADLEEVNQPCAIWRRSLLGRGGGAPGPEEGAHLGVQITATVRPLAFTLSKVGSFLRVLSIGLM